MLRDELDVLVLPVDPGSACFAARTLAGEPFGVAASAAGSLHPGFDLGATMSLLLRHHALVALHRPVAISLC